MATAQELLIRILGDGAQFRSDLADDQAEINRLYDSMSEIHDVLSTVHVDDEEAQENIEELRADLDEIRDRTARVDINTDEGRAELTQIRADLADLRDRTVDIHVDDAEAMMSIRNVRAALDSLQDRTVHIHEEHDMSNMSGMGNDMQGMDMGPNYLVQTILTALPLISPLVGAAVGGVMALSSAFAAASAGAVGFGAVAIPNIKTITDATSQLSAAQKQYDLATNKTQRLAALQKEKAALYGLDDAQKNAVKSLQSFESFWNGFAKSFQTPVLNMFSEGLNTLQTLLTNLKPTISAAASAFQGLLTSFQQSLGTPPVQAFFNYLAQDAGPTITTFGNIAGNVLEGVMNLLVDFGPLGQQMAGGLLQLTQRFESWTESVGKSQGFKEFISYVQANGPNILSILGNVAKAVGNILVALAPMGTVMVNVLKSFSQWLATFTKMHPILLQIIAAVLVSVGTFNLLKGPFEFLGGMGGKVIEIFKALTTALLGTREAEEGVALGEATMEAMNPAAWVALIIAAIVGLALLIATHWDQIKKTTIAVWNSIVSFFSTWGQRIVQAISEFLSRASATISRIWSAVSKETSQIWNDILNFLSKIWSSIVKGAEATGHGIQSAWSFLTSIASKIWRTIVVIIQTYLNIIKTFAATWIVFLDQLFTGHWNKLGLVFKDGAKKLWEVVKSGLDQIAQIWGINTKEVEATVVGWFNSVVSWFEKLPGRLMNAAQSAWNSVSSAFMNGVNTVINTVTNWYNNVVKWFEQLPGRASNAATSTWNSTTSAFNSGANNVISTVTRWYSNTISWFEQLPGNVANSARNMWNSVKSAFSSGVSDAEGTVSYLVSTVEWYFANLPSMAWNWGSNMIGGFVDGIKSAVGKVTGAVSNVINAAKKYIGFNSPSEEGEGQHIVEWGENMIGGFIDGIQNAVPKLKAVMSNVIAPPKLAVSSNVGNMITGNTGYGGNSTGQSASGQASNSYTHQGPLLNIEHLHVRNDQDITKLQQMLFNTHESVVRGMGKRL
jgi:phage-related protein